MIRVNLDKAKIIAHNMRRNMRAEEFALFDKIIAAQIPGNDLVKAEAERAKIRDKYAVMQISIDKAKTPDQIKIALEPK